jgi:hypothetical protein
MSERIERIERYIAGDMSAEEKLVFEQEMLDDQKLRTDVDNMMVIEKTLEVSVEEDLRMMLNRLEANQLKATVESKVTKIRSLNNRLAAAAGILIIISLGLWFLVGRGASGMEQFTDNNYVGYDYAQIRGEYSLRSDFPSDISGDNDNKQKVAQWFLAWLESHPDDDEARYVHASLLKELGQSEKAKSELATIIAHQSILWGEKAEWNYVLLSVGDSWDELAVKTFQKMLTDPAHSYHRQAKELEVLKKK